MSLMEIFRDGLAPLAKEVYDCAKDNNVNQIKERNYIALEIYDNNLP